MISSLSEIVESEVIEKCVDVAGRISGGYPLEYALGYTYFLGIKLKVTQDVLIPRPDTELLVIEAEKIELTCKTKVLDLCTGSGCIAISLKKRNPKISVTASDISKKALEIARENSNKNKTEIQFIKSNIFDSIEEKFDIIVSNPPYIMTDLITKLEREISHEPMLALDGGADGMGIYRRIEEKLKNHLSENGSLLLEIERQNEYTIPMLKDIFQEWSFEIINDLSGRPRVAIIRRAR